MAESTDTLLRDRLTEHLAQVTAVVPSADFEPRLLAIADPDRADGARHRLSGLLAGLVTAAVLASVAGAALWAHARDTDERARGAAHDVPGSATLRTFSGLGSSLQFSYPSTWRVVLPPPATFPAQGVSETWTIPVSPLVALSPEPVEPRCVAVTGYCVANPTAGHLAAGGLVVTWSSANGVGRIGTGLAALSGNPTTVSGLSAQIDTTLLPACQAIGGSASTTVVINLGSRSEADAMTACFRGPDTSAGRQQVSAMLASARIPSLAEQGQAGFSAPDHPSESDPGAFAYWDVAAFGQYVCPGDVWPGSPATPTSSGIPGGMVVIQTPGPCLPPPPGSASPKPFDRTLTGTYVIHVDSCQSAAAYDVTIVADAQDALHLVSERPSKRSAHPACP